MSKTIQSWLKKANRSERARLATIAGTQISYLFQLATGHRIASAETAGRLEKASEQLAKTSDLPVIRREDVCPACSVCPLAKAARKSQEDEE